MKNGRIFDIGDILSVTTDKLVSLRRMSGLRDILRHVLGDETLNDTGLAMHADAAKMFLQTELPWVKEVTLPKLPEGLTNEEQWAFVDSFVKQAATKYGETHEVGQMSSKPDISRAAASKYVQKILSKREGKTVDYDAARAEGRITGLSK